MPPPDPQYYCVYETRDQYHAAVEEHVFDLALPHYEGYDANGQLVESGLLSDADGHLQADPAGRCQSDHGGRIRYAE